MKKIMFNERYGLQRAAIDGTKPMTRRSVPEKWQTPLTEIFEDCNYDYSAFWKQSDVQFIMYEKAPYKVGEIVAIAQSYKSVFEESLNYALPRYHWLDDHIDEKGFENKMFVKASEMPHRIQFTDLKIERLQDISVEDCMKEGVFQWDDPFHEDRVENFVFVGATKHYATPREAFAALIDKVSGRGTWDRNPWVFAYMFELVKQQSYDKRTN